MNRSLLLLLALPLFAGAAPVPRWLSSADAPRRTDRGFEITGRLPDGTRVPVRIEALAEGIVRVRANLAGKFDPTMPERDGLLRADWPQAPARYTAAEGRASLSTAAVTVEVALAPLRFSFRTGGKTVVRTAGSGLGFDPGHAWIAIESPAGEKFLGFSDQRSGGEGFPPDGAALDHRGKYLVMAGLGSNRVYYSPFYMSSRGYGFLLNTTFQSDWDMAKTAADRSTIRINEPRIDFYVIAGPKLAAVLDRYTSITGKPPLPPSFVLDDRKEAKERRDTKPIGKGVNKMNERWYVQSEIEASARAIREEKSPVGIYRLDSAWESIRNSFDWVPQIPDPAGLIATLNRLHFKVSMWQRPTLVKDDYPLYREAEQKGWLALGPDGKPFVFDRFGGPSAMWDFTNPAARKAWQEKIAQLVRMGVRTFKLDSSSSGYVVAAPEVLDVRFHNGLTGREMDNYYGAFYLKTVWETLRANLQGKRAVVYCYHSMYFAGPRFPMAELGDRTDRSSPAVQVRTAQNNGLSGIAFWQGGDYGSGGLPGASTEQTQRLAPYIYTHWRKAHETGLPVVRAMPLEDQDDPNMYLADTQYLFGDAYLVAPLITGSPNWEGVYFPETERKNYLGKRYPSGRVDYQRIYLPRGEWIAAGGNARFIGPGWKFVKGKPNRPTVLIRAGSIIPQGPTYEYAGQKPLDAVTLDIYPSGDSSFSMYEDDGDTYGYEKGEFARTAFHSRETASGIRIEIEAAKGKFPGMPGEREYILQVRCTTAPKSVTLDGAPLPRFRDEGAGEAVEVEGLDDEDLSASQARFRGSGPGWYYSMKDGHKRAVFVRLPRVPTSRRLSVEMEGAAVVRYILD